jgi:peptidoglycan/xylan/chitin deacetylase (PgdA/CDA1 family)
MVKSVVEGLLLAGPARLARLGMRGRALVLAYHNVVPPGEPPFGDRSVHLPQRAFAAQLDALLREADVVPLAELDRGGMGRRARVAITFDDAYYGALTAGLEELARRGIPATIFVAPGLLGRESFWWDALAQAGALTPSSRLSFLDRLHGEDARIRAWAHQSGFHLAASPIWARGGTEEQLRRAASTGCTLGSHTWSHLNLARTTDPQLTNELARSLEWLRGRFSVTVPWLAYPYGLQSERVRVAAAAVGYVGAFRVSGGWMGRQSDRWNLPRFNVPTGLSLAGFRLRLSGLLST